MARPGPDSVLGRFDGRAVELPDGRVTPGGDGAGWWMDVEAGGRRVRHAVALVLASGRQHQVYVTEDSEGVLRLLPLLWSTFGDAWLPLSLYQPSSLDPVAPDSWQRRDIVTSGCLNCHLSQVSYAPGEGGLHTSWVDLPVNCEACHGPGRDHVDRMLLGEEATGYRRLADLGKHEEAQLCGRCHGNRASFRLDLDAHGKPRFYPRTLADPFVRPDGTQRMTGYQFSGHVLAGCYRNGAVQCRYCHDPHGGAARSLADQPAIGRRADEQCTVCHRNYAAPKAARAHSRHSDKVGCIPCHMAWSWIGDSPERQQRTADHTISTPRPRETLVAGIPNACNTCHDDQEVDWSLRALEEWGQASALEVRPWVRAAHQARSGRPEAADPLLTLADDETAGTYLRGSALDLAGRLPPSPRLVAGLTPHVADDDPWLRGLTLVALMRHDVGRTARWRTRALGDPHPVTRLVVLGRDATRDAVPLADLKRAVVDGMRWRQRPRLPDVVPLVRRYLKRGEPRRAMQLLDRLADYLSPTEGAQPSLAELRRTAKSLLEGGRFDRPWARHEASQPLAPGP